MKITFTVLFFIVNLSFCLSQNQRKLDSLQNIYNTTQNDTFKIDALLQIASSFLQTKPDTALFMLNEGIKLAEKVRLKRAISFAKHHIGLVYHYQSKFDTALKYYEEGLKIREENKDKSGLVTSLNNIAVIYQTQGNFALALERYERCVIILKELKNKSAVGTIKNNMASIYMNMGNYSLSLATHLECLKIREELNDKDGLLSSYINIGNVYKAQNETDLALQYYIKGLEFEKIVKNKLNLSALLNNIGTIYKDKGKLDLAMDFYQKALVLKEEVKDKKGLASAYINIGGIYEMKDSVAKALIYFDKALLVQEEIKDKQGKQLSYNGITVCYIKLKNYDKALSFANLALQICIELKTPKEAKEAMIQLYRIYKLKNDFATALDYYEKAKNINDSLFSIEKSKAVSNLESRYNLDKKEKEFAILQRDKEISDQAGKLNALEAESKQRQLEIYEKQAEADHLLELARAEKDRRKADSLLNLAQKAQLEADNLQILKEKQDFAYKAEKEKQDLLYQAEIAEQKRVQYTYMGISGTFLIVLLLVAIGFKQKQKANRLLATQNDEIRKQQLEIAEKNDNLNQANEELQQQQEELIVLTENLEAQKKTIQVSFESLALLSEIGKEISISLDIKQIIHTVYFHVNTLMKVEGFGIGIYNEISNSLDFEGFIENGKELDFQQDFLDNPRLFSAYCFNHQSEIFINNLSVEYKNYISEVSFVSGEADVQSLIYLPLNNEKNKIGVITVQSFQKNAYQEQHVSILQHIANYTAAALQKADAFRYIKKQGDELKLLNFDLANQKQTIETTYQKLKHTTEQLDKSIQYASHIQSIVMPEEQELRNYFSDLFILFRPRDVVSGDFYWFSQISEDLAIFSLADCTGHGVPGAFMSMLGSTILHETVNVKLVHNDPAKILKNVHYAIRKILKQREKKNNDGMDISLCIFKKNKENKTVEFTFSGAKSAMSYVANGEIFDLKGDKQYLGGDALQHDFTNFHFILPENTCFYLYSDGFQDQNNPQRKRLGSKAFKEVLIKNAKENFAIQKTNLEKVLDEHRQGEEQRDDISVIGLRI